MSGFRQQKTKPNKANLRWGGCAIGLGRAVLVRFGNLLEEDAFAGIVVGVEGELVVMVFFGIDYLFWEVEAVGPP